MASSEQEELAAIAEDLRGHLEWLRDSGVERLPAPRFDPAEGPGGRAAPSTQAPVSRAAGPAGGSLRAAVRAAVGAPGEAARGRQSGAPSGGGAPAQPPSEVRSLEQIRAELGDCRRCQLAGGRSHLVFGVGDPRAELVFVGEGPGEEEDRQGIPFVGRAGELLTKMIEAMGFSRDRVYICNVVKCRPPGNRNPEPVEIAACEPFLRAQLASLRPKVIVTLGKFAAQTLLRDETSISRLRGNWREYCGIRLMPTFHPAYLLRSPAEKRKTWEDLKLVMKELGRDPAAS